jgi:hypothetical protein
MEIDQFEGMKNGSPVICRWCKEKVITYAGHKVLMNLEDALDYDWACANCYTKIIHREL